ncbi:FAD-dependent monooxygenase [Gammaproteobacteria bacterium]|nr:FAD-dependent monooxygenase [Gammaproteobacteria bacterium]
MNNLSNRVGIIGGGIAGLTLGCTLLKEGIPAVIFEQSSEEKSHGAAISLSLNALRLLDRINIFSNLKDQSFVNTKASINSPQHAICEFKTPEVLTTRRQTLMTLLLEQYVSLGGEIFYQHTFKSFDQSNCEATFKNNEKYSLSHLVACDGIRSSIREQFFTPNQKPRYSGYSAWRGMGKSNLQNVHFALGPGSHIVSYPINNENDVSFVACTKEEYEFTESWKEEGSYNDLLDDFSIYDPKIFPVIEDSMKLYKWGIYIRPPLKSMIAHNLTLVGDAAHPMVPFLGQGACMAIEDAYAFGMLCKITNGDFAEAQKVFNAVRRSRTKKIQRSSMMQGKIYHMKNPVLVAARNAAMRYTNIPGNDLKSIHDYDVEDAIKIYMMVGRYGSNISPGS